MMQHTRRAHRVDLDCDIELDADSVTFPCEGLNLSSTGMALATPARFEKNQQVWIGFDADHQQCRLMLPGRIVRGEAKKHAYLWGVRFCGLDHVMREKLEERILFEQSIFKNLPPLLP
jgi:hypothetical protein